MPNTQITEEVLPLRWEDSEKYLSKFKEKAARQFLATWSKHKDRRDDELRWGEEIEYLLVNVDDKSASAALCADQVLRTLGSETDGGGDPTVGAGWRTEFGNDMVEGVTHPPFSWLLDDVLKVELALKWRREALQQAVTQVSPGTLVMTLAAFPLLGCAGCTAPEAEPSPNGDVSCSLLCPDEVVSPHPRYQTFVRNYRVRKGCKVGAFIPRADVSADQRLTPAEIERLPFELARRGGRERDPVPGHIYMDAQAFGAAQCCTQCTFLTHTLEDARYLVDQFLVLAPLFLALTAATPFLRGLVADTDTRWLGFQQTWDDRQETELTTVHRPRCSPCDLFISASLVDDKDAQQKVNDVKVAVHKPAYDELVRAGVDPVLSRHVARLLVRDPLMVFESKMDADDGSAMDHFEQLQGTNWNNVRFKPPPAGGGIGWRVEFRSPEVQITDFENAAVVVVIRTLAECIMEERWDLAIPISLCDANDAASSLRNAASTGVFWFRVCEEVKQQPLQDILCGADGIFTRCKRWLQRKHDAGQCSSDAKEMIFEYMALFEKRSRGELPTPACWMRARLAKHASNNGDGLVPGAFVRDLCKFAAKANDFSEVDSEDLAALLSEDLAALLGDSESARKRKRIE